MSFESTRWPGEIHLYAISLDNPQKYEPQLHCHFAERVDWLNTVDALQNTMCRQKSTDCVTEWREYRGYSYLK